MNAFELFSITGMLAGGAVGGWFGSRFGVGGLVIGAIAGAFAGLAAGLATAIAAIWASAPGRGSRQANAAKAAFEQEHLGIKPMVWKCISEKHRWVVMLCYGNTKPPSYCFYAVARDTYQATRIEDDSLYAPKVWR